jgi:hypothetical protein
VKPVPLLVVAALVAVLAGCGSDLPPVPTKATWSTASEDPGSASATTTTPTTTPAAQALVGGGGADAALDAPPTRRATTYRRPPTTTAPRAVAPRTTAPRTTTAAATTTTKSSGLYFRSCADARDAGAAPMNAGEPGYRPALDRNKDGVACEDD